MKTMKKCAALILAAAMLLSMMVTGAGATGSDTKKYEVLTLTDDLVINETLKLEKDETLVPNVTYEFAVVGAPVLIEGEALGGATGTPRFTVDKVAFSAADNGSVIRVGTGDYSRQVTKQAKLSLAGVEFTEPGIYRWEISKTRNYAPAEGSLEFPTNNKQTTYVYVTVVDDPDNLLKLKLASYVYTTADKLPQAAGGIRYFELDGERAQRIPNVEKIDSIEDMYPTRTRDLTFGKKVAGNRGSKDKYFKFSLEITGLTPGTSYAVSGQDKVNIEKTDATVYEAATIIGANDRTALVADGDGKIKQDFYLQHGDYVTVKGLPVGAEYTVTEDKEIYTATNGTDDLVREALAGYEDSVNARLTALARLIPEKEAEITAKQGEINAKATEIATASANPPTMQELQNQIDALKTDKAALPTPVPSDVDPLATEVANYDALIEAKQTAIINKKAEIQANYGDIDNGGTKAAYDAALAAYEAALDTLTQKQNARYDAQIELDRARKAKANADAALANAQGAKTAAEQALANALASQIAAVNALDEAQAKLDFAEQAQALAEAALNGMDANDPGYQEAVDAAVAAQDATNAARAVRNAARDAKTAADAAVTAAQNDKTAADQAAAAAQTAADDAQTAVDAAAQALTTAEEALGDDTKGAVKALNDAQADLTAKRTAVSRTNADYEAALIELQKLYDNATATDTQGLGLKQLNALKAAKQGELTALLAQNRDRQQAIDNVDNEIAKKKDEMAKKDAELKRLEAEKAALEAQKTRLTDELAMLNAEKAALEDEKTSLLTKRFTDPTKGTIKLANVYTGYTNTLETIVPTGVILQLGAPIVGVAAAIILLAVVMMGKKKKQNA